MSLMARAAPADAMLLWKCRPYAESRSRAFDRQLEQIAAAFASPEEIKDSPQTAPSKRLLHIHPAYQKVLDGLRIAKGIGMQRIRDRCRHFDGWLRRIEALGGRIE